MTIVAGLIHENKVYMGADTLLSSEDSKVTISRPKIFKRDDMIIGYSGSLREGQVIETDFKPPKRGKGDDDYTYVAHEVTIEFSKIMSRYKLEDRAATTKEFNSCWLIAYGGKFYEMQFDLSVWVPRRSFAAIGTGPAQYAALGSLFTSGGSVYEDNPEIRLKTALLAAESVCPAVSQPFDFLTLELE